MKIRRLQEDDLPNIAGLVYRIMGTKDAKRAVVDIKETLSEKEESPFKFEDLFVVEIGGSIVAAGGVWALKHDPDVARLDWFMVDKQHQRKGLGTMLLKKIEEFLGKKGVRLIMAETSSRSTYRAAVNFWEKNGFREMAKIPNYWEDGSACLYFIKRLKHQKL